MISLQCAVCGPGILRSSSIWIVAVMTGFKGSRHIDALAGGVVIAL